MIQRLQSVFLFLAFLMDMAVFFTPVYSHAMDDPLAWIGIGFALVLTAAAVLSFVSVFLYKDRVNQMKWVKWTMLVQVAALGFAIGVFISLGGFGLWLWDEAIGVGFTLLGLAAQIQAHRLIKKDENLVRSMDRIR